MNVADIIKDKQNTLLTGQPSIEKVKLRLVDVMKNKDFFRTDKTYISFKTQAHFFRKYNGFGFSASLLLKLVERNCREIIIIYTDGETETVYTATPELYLEKGIIHLDKKLDYQRILSLDYLKVRV